MIMLIDLPLIIIGFQLSSVNCYSTYSNILPTAATNNIISIYHFNKHDITNINHHQYITITSSSRNMPRDLHMMSSRRGMMSMNMNPKRSLFFDIVTSGLQDRFPATVDSRSSSSSSSSSSINRIHKFILYAKNEVPLPSIDKSSMHEPCEEYIEGTVV
jgi:hypothetical protein